MSANSRGYAAVLADGSVLAISPTGRILGQTPFDAGDAQSAVLAAPGLIVETVEGLEIHRGAAVVRIPLPAGARFLGYSQGTVAYGTGKQLRLRRIANGNDVLFRTLAPRFEAQLGRRGLAYASGRMLGFTAWVNLSGSSLERRHLDVEEVAVEPVAEDHVVVLDELELVLLVIRERPNLDALGRDRPDALASADALGAVRRPDRGLDRFRERRQRPGGHVFFDEQRPVGKRREMDLVSG